MSKTVEAIVETILTGEQVRAAVLVRMEFATPSSFLRVCNAGHSIFWNEGAGELEYLGVGELGNLSALGEGTELQAYSIQLSITGVPVANITEAFAENYQNEPVIIYLAALTDDNTVAFTTNEEDGPVIMFAGTMDDMTIDLGETATITINCISRLSDWERPRGGRFNHVDQQRYDSTDDGFEFMEALKGREFIWGNNILKLPGGPRPGPRDDSEFDQPLK